MQVAKTILSSQLQGSNKRLTTMVLRYPRWIHAEQRTHRVIKLGEVFDLPTPSIMECSDLSRNAGSSRALPVSKMIQDVLDNPAIPQFWGLEQRGMQAGAECDNPVMVNGQLLTKQGAWLAARDNAIALAQAFADAGYHKQIINRILEPFSFITVVVSATEWSNFLALRDHEDAEPHIQVVARAVAAELSKPAMQTLVAGEWHLPFVTGTTQWDDLCKSFTKPHIRLDAAKRISSACCASASYKTVDGFDMTLERAGRVYGKLVEKPPLHASPFEHIAQADENIGSPEDGDLWANPKQHRNFVGFRQLRAMLPNDTL